MNQTVTKAEKQSKYKNLVQSSESERPEMHQ